MKKILVSLIFIAFNIALSAQTISITNAGFNSVNFGGRLTVLPNGNFVVQDLLYDNGAVQNVGAVYLYNGSNLSLISTLTGSQASDQIGSGGIIVLSNGNFVISSPLYSNGALTNVGAVTWVNGTTGLNGVVSASNSLVGSSSYDKVGYNFNTNKGITLLANGNYLISSPAWTNGTIAGAGAVTWANGNIGITGIISSANSLVGGSASDVVGIEDITILTNGNYVVKNPNWDNGASTNAGAVTWANGNTGLSGLVSVTNSLVGTYPNDIVGSGGITLLTNGNYVVSSPNWDNGGTKDRAGAATWGNGTMGVMGEINDFNSLTGSNSGDLVGLFVTALTNGNYVVASPKWANGIFEKAGAATWGNGATGVTGEINSSNSLIGQQQDDQISQEPITALTNGNYVVNSPFCANGINIKAGAATWGNGITGIAGIISSSNSLVGTKSNDQVGLGSFALSNSNYVVASPNWANATIVQAGAATWGNGSTGITGAVSITNSLVGTKTLDRISGRGVTILNNGNYLVRSPNWANVTVQGAGAVTWGSGTAGITGNVGSSNSLLGSTNNGDAFGNVGKIAPTVLNNNNYVVLSQTAATWGNGTFGVTGAVNSINSLMGLESGSFIVPLTNGNYVVSNRDWSNGAIQSAGAVTFGKGNIGISGTISAANSLVGITVNDKVGLYGVTALSNGNYVVNSASSNIGTLVAAGAVTWGNGNTGITGTISISNSLIGSKTGDVVGSDGIIKLNNGNYIIKSEEWDKGSVVNAGAVTWGNGSTNLTGVINACNSVAGGVTPPSSSPYLSKANFSIAYNTTYNYMLVGKPLQNTVDIYNPTGMQLAIHLDSVIQNINGNALTSLLVVNGCRIIATLLPTGTTNAVAGTVTAKVWNETTQPAFFVKRHYEITPTANASNATGKVTLYFTQQEFTDFNALNAVKLPIDAADAANNKANLLIEKQTGVSSNGTGLPISYPTTNTPVTINPADADIFYNSLYSRWEVSFNVTGFGGFFVKTTIAALPNIYTFNGNGNWGDASNWLGGYIPPTNLTAPNEILINPIINGECVLPITVTQTIASGAKITVAASKKLRIGGNLIIQ